MTVLTEFNVWFKEKREEMGLSRDSVARLLGISRKTAYDYEFKPKYPSFAISRRIEKLMGTMPERPEKPWPTVVTVTKAVTRWHEIPAQWVAEECKKRGMTQEGLAEATGIRIDYVRGWAHGHGIKEPHLVLVLRHLSRRKILPAFEDKQDLEDYLQELEQTRRLINAIIGRPNPPIIEGASVQETSL
jgi:transcriptional regulator with XRE-family HTH domain